MEVGSGSHSFSATIEEPVPVEKPALFFNADLDQSAALEMEPLR